MPKKEARKFEIEILDLKGEKREEAMRYYRRLLKSKDKPLYLARSAE